MSVLPACSVYIAYPWRPEMVLGLWNWSYRGLLTAMWVLEIKPRSFATSAFNHGANTPAPGVPLLTHSRGTEQTGAWILLFSQEIFPRDNFNSLQMEGKSTNTKQKPL